MPRQNLTNHWTTKGRAVVFVLAASSIACLLLDFYGVCPMRPFTFFVFLPAVLALFAIAVADKMTGDGILWRNVMIGLAAGLIAAVAYDIFRLPFVFAKSWGIDSVVPPMNLFKVFPRFGAMILGQPIEQASYSPATHLVGWIYHFSNGLTFGVMYLAMMGDGTKRKWFWAVVMAVGLELGMLFTPYPNVFGIHLSGFFIIVTLTAHLIFGVVMGKAAQQFSLHWEPKKVPA